MNRNVAIVCAMVCLLIVPAGGCSDNSPGPASPKLGTDSAQTDHWAQRDILGRYRVEFDNMQASPTVIPLRDGVLDKKILDQDAFQLVVKYLGYKQDPMCPSDWLAGDITVEIEITNLTGIDYYDIWLAVIDSYGAELTDPDSWATASTFDVKLPYIAFGTDNPSRCLPDGHSDSQIRTWRNPCDHPSFDVDLLLVGTPAHESETPKQIIPDPSVIEIPVWDPPSTVNIRAYVIDPQGDATVSVNFSELGFPYTLPLYDDGQHDDGDALDKLFATGNLPVIDIPNGKYNAWIRAASPGDIITVYNRVKIQFGYIEPEWDDPVSVTYSGPLRQLGMCRPEFDSKGRLHLAWGERFDWGGTYIYFFRYRTWFNGEFSETVFLNEDTLIDGGAHEYLASPQLIITQQDDIYVIWHQWDPSDDGDMAIFCAANHNGNWTSTIRIDADMPGSIFNPQTGICSDGRIFLVAEYSREGKYGICITHTESGLNDWTPTEPLITSGTWDTLNLDTAECLATSTDDMLYLCYEKQEGVWPDSNIYFTAINPDSLEYSEPVRVNDPDDANKRDSHPCLWIDPSGIIGIAWEGTKTPGIPSSIYYDLSFNSGETWCEDIHLPAGDINYQILPMVKPLAEGIWGIVFNYDHKNFFMLTVDGGETFSEPELIVGIGSSQFPNFTVSDDFETWHTWRSNYINTDYNIFLNRRYYK